MVARELAQTAQDVGTPGGFVVLAVGGERLPGVRAGRQLGGDRHLLQLVRPVAQLLPVPGRVLVRGDVGDVTSRG
ncbi:hypothetical protein SMICM17S_08139 [Streptomyces microflavus]